MMTDFQETNTPEMCIKTCLGGSFTFAGVQHKSQCFCGNIASPESALATEAEQCDRPCPGDETQMWEGTWRMNVYDISQ
jgi:beta-D-xylosidase 4